jgi:uncharacterized membrane protein (UPF0127 family)
MADARPLQQARNLSRGTVVAERLEVASSFWARFMGLMGRGSLPQGGGLFLTGNGIHMFFMRFPIDAVFVSGEDGEGRRRVVAVRERLAPWTGLVPLIRGAAAVIELPVGTIVGSGTRAGDTVVLESVDADGAAGAAI